MGWFGWIVILLLFAGLYWELHAIRQILLGMAQGLDNRFNATNRTIDAVGDDVSFIKRRFDNSWP